MHGAAGEGECGDLDVAFDIALVGLRAFFVSGSRIE